LPASRIPAASRFAGGIRHHRGPFTPFCADRLAYCTVPGLPDTLPLLSDCARPTGSPSITSMRFHRGPNVCSSVRAYLACVQLASAPREAKATFVNLWRQLFRISRRAACGLARLPSPNLLLLAGVRASPVWASLIARLCPWGHPAYDARLALQERARFDVPQDPELKLLALYARGDCARGRISLECGRVCPPIACLWARSARPRPCQISPASDARDHKPSILRTFPGSKNIWPQTCDIRL